MAEERTQFDLLHNHDSINSQRVQEKNIGFADITNNNSSTTKHGYLPKLSGNASDFLNGQGDFTPSSGGILPVADGGTGSSTLLGAGIPTVVGSDRATGKTAAFSLATYTVPASDSSFIVSANLNVTTSTTFSIGVTCTYTDETNTSRTLTLTFSTLAGVFLTAITNGFGASAYEGIPLHIRAKANTTIILATVGTFTTVTYNFEELIVLYK